MFVRVAVALVLLAPPAAAEPGVCDVVDVTLRPEVRTDLRPANTHAPQIVVWVEDAAGAFVDTVFITQKTGTFGLGNRPGRYDFNSGPRWPYGRRVTTFPVWADKKPERFDTIMFQDGRESNLSHSSGESSIEVFYCRPIDPGEPLYDAISCASPTGNLIETDKGLRATAQSKYPPRQDMVRDPNDDHAAVDTYRDMNPYDAISSATPAPGEIATIGWAAPPRLADGDYVMWVEVSTEFDHNATYSREAFPAPVGISFAAYGEPYRGQPSLVYRVPFTVGADGITTTATYAGYGDPTGEDGAIRPPDATITTGVAGSGEGRLALVQDPNGAYRVRVETRRELDLVVPNAPSQLAVSAMTSRAATISFVAPGDDAVMGTVRGYEVRYRVDGEVTADNFDAPDTIVVPPSLVPVAAGELQELELSGLLPQTRYFVGVRAYDDCQNTSPIGALAFVTPDRTSGEVDACFIATAAYGSPLAADVVALRGVRDALLRQTVLGELAVEAYYTFGPPVAGAIGESELLRATARAALAPIVNRVKHLAR